MNVPFGRVTCTVRRNESSNCMEEKQRFWKRWGWLVILIALQMVGAMVLACHTSAGGDPVFTFTLANSPYEFNYIDNKIDKFPGENGWFAARILKEQYVVEGYDRFNYSGVYWHQRIDNHPLLYYSMVHTICSLFPGTYSILYALVINIAALLLIDWILLRIAQLLFCRHPRAGALVLLITSTSMITFYGMVRLARMYMLLALMCLWFLWICLRLLQQQKVHSAEILLCVLLGSQTHYYFYVYGALLGCGTLLFLAVQRKWKEIVHIFWAASLGEMCSLMLFPWVVWHIIFNQMDKNETLTGWTTEMLRNYAHFVNQSVFNGRGRLWLCVLLVVVLSGLWKKVRKKERSRTEEYTWAMLAGTTLLYSAVIFNLNGAVTHYATPVYLPTCILLSGMVMQLVGVGERVIGPAKKLKYESVCFTAAAGALAVLLSGSTTNLRDCFANAVDGYHAYMGMHQVSEAYQGADCLYVAGKEDNLLESLWFEFGEYDEFKRVSAEEYEQLIAEGEWSEILKGRDTENEIILYLPENLSLPEGAELLAVNNGFQAALIGSDAV